MSGRGNADRRAVLWLGAGVLLIIALTAIFAPVTRDDDPTPSTFNTGTFGAKGAYLLLGALGYSVSRSDATAAATLDDADAPHTTYILATPNAPSVETQKAEYAAVERFLRRGGRVLATGFRGAYFLPGGRTGEPTQLLNGLCTTTTEGNSDLAQAGAVSTYDATPWSSEEPAVRVDHRCGNDAVVVHRPYAHGGEFIWWSVAEPLSNRGIAQDNSLHLLLTAIGPASGPGARRVVFDEFYHGQQGTASDYLKGLPMRSLLMHVLLIVGLLIFSFSRRSGPLREPVRVPRTSPVEFAQNMGALYERAGATQPATEAARRRLLDALSQCGFSAESLRGSAGEIAALVHGRFGVETSLLQSVMERAEAARYDRLRPREALALVRALDEEIRKLRETIRPAATVGSKTSMETT